MTLFINYIFMGLIVVLSNYFSSISSALSWSSEILTYGAFSYPITFLITDLANRAYGVQVARKIVYIGFFIGVIFTLLVSTNFSGLYPLESLLDLVSVFYCSKFRHKNFR